MKKIEKPRAKHIRLTVFLQPEDHKRLKIAAIARDSNMCAVALELIREGVKSVLAEVKAKL